MQQAGLLEKCKFAAPWLKDNVDLFDLEELELENNMDATRKLLLLYGAASVVTVFLLVLTSCKIFGKIFFSRSIDINKRKKD